MFFFFSKKNYFWTSYKGMLFTINFSQYFSNKDIMTIKCFKTVIFTLLFCNVIFLTSCEKQDITFKTNPVSTVLPEYCENCHNNSFPEHMTNAHSKHTTGLYAYDCNTCHYGYGWETKEHMNAKKDIRISKFGLTTRNGLDDNTPLWDTETKTCTNIYCHSNGVTADRGTDGSYIWTTNSIPFAPVVYATTPSWDKGKITECNSCHNGKGNMTSPYTIERPNKMEMNDYPSTGQHRLMYHMSNNNEFSNSPYLAPYWDGVQCFWCHSTKATDITSINGPINQGTYGTVYHVDGSTYFKPLNISDGGTMANGSIFSENGSRAHCGSGKKCW
jgi:predicted CxxxxCH...CXXCH cytochrome family protein